MIEYEADINTRNGKMRSGYTQLLFTKTEAKYFHPSWPALSGTGFRNGKPYYAFGDPEQMPVYTNLEKNIIQYKTDYSVFDGEHFIFTDTIPKISWDIFPEDTMQIYQFTALKARGHFGGRDYTAWFTPEIPVPFGPYWFGGLPGMIIFLDSEDGLVHFEMVAFEAAVADLEEITPPRVGKHVDMGEFKEHVIKKLLVAESFSSETGTSTNRNPPPNHDIIKNRWTIIKNYKAERGY